VRKQGGAPGAKVGVGCARVHKKHRNGQQRDNMSLCSNLQSQRPDWESKGERTSMASHPCRIPILTIQRERVMCCRQWHLKSRVRGYPESTETGGKFSGGWGGEVKDAKPEGRGKGCEKGGLHKTKKKEVNVRLSLHFPGNSFLENPTTRKKCGKNNYGAHGGWRYSRKTIRVPKLESNGSGTTPGE